jgi:hypothetical protein
MKNFLKVLIVQFQAKNGELNWSKKRLPGGLLGRLLLKVLNIITLPKPITHRAGEWLI